jgi:hypothetical protein
VCEVFRSSQSQTAGGCEGRPQSLVLSAPRERRPEAGASEARGPGSSGRGEFRIALTGRSRETHRHGDLRAASPTRRCGAGGGSTSGSKVLLDVLLSVEIVEAARDGRC